MTDQGTTDPRVIESVAIQVPDLVRAAEARARDRAAAVLRVTPPYSGRMRARLHVAANNSYDPTRPETPIHLMPGALLTDFPTFPTPDETEEQLRAADVAYTPERHHDYHQTQVITWRTQIAASIAEATTITVAESSHTIDVLTLGEWEPQETPDTEFSIKS